MCDLGMFPAGVKGFCNTCKHEKTKWDEFPCDECTRGESNRWEDKEIDLRKVQETDGDSNETDTRERRSGRV